jgi:hypothetical protein
VTTPNDCLQFVDEQFKPPLPLPDIDARTHALRRFRKFLSLLVFRREGAIGGEPIPFQIPEENIYIEQPDNVSDLVFPSIVFIPSRGTYDGYGLGPGIMLDDSLDKFGKGTALVYLGEYTETFTLEVWGSKQGERRAMMAAIETAMLANPSVWALRIKLPDYFDNVATFYPVQRELVDDPETARNRRRGHIFVMLSVPWILQVNARTLQPLVAVDITASL